MNVLDSLLTIANDSCNEIESLESLIELTKKYCLDREINAIYYNLETTEKKVLSEERNHYINLLEIASEKVLLLKSKCLELETFVTKLH